jgi:hypothetical protein
MTAPLDEFAAAPDRRRVLRLFASLPLLSAMGGKILSGPHGHLVPLADPAIPPDPFRRPAALLVAGPPQGTLHAWAQLVAPVMARSLPPDSTIAISSVGGQDGVTAANQFGARAAPDGRTLLFTPGAAALAWMVGETRAKFDVGAWTPVIGASSPGVLMGRFGSEALRAGGVLRLAVDRLPGPDLAGLLALSLLGGVPHAITGLGPAAAEAALLGGHLDAVVLTGENATTVAARLSARGVPIVASFGALDRVGALRRDPAFPTVPEVSELAAALHGRPLSGPLYRAWRGCAAAAQLVFGIELPALTPSAMVALWRRAGSEAVDQPDLAAALATGTLRPLTGADALATARTIAVDGPALLALRQWLSMRRDVHIG